MRPVRQTKFTDVKIFEEMVVGRDEPPTELSVAQVVEIQWGYFLDHYRNRTGPMFVPDGVGEALVKSAECDSCIP